MKTIFPVLIGLGLALIIIFSYILFFPGALTAEKAVTGYLKSSMTWDVNGIMKYASDYQKISLYGTQEYSTRNFKNKLKGQYSKGKNIYADKKITFSILNNIEIDKDSDEYANIVDNYKSMTGKSDFSNVRQITVKTFVDGKQIQKSTVYAIKSGISWFYLAY